MVLNIRDTGEKINNMVKVKNLGQIQLNMMVITFRARNMVKAFLDGQTEQFTMDNFKTII